MAKPFLPPVKSNVNNVIIPLTKGKFAYLSYPKNITEKDIEIIFKYLEIIELTLLDDNEVIPKDL